MSRIRKNRSEIIEICRIVGNNDVSDNEAEKMQMPLISESAVYRKAAEIMHDKTFCTIGYAIDLAAHLPEYPALSMCMGMRDHEEMMDYFGFFRPLIASKHQKVMALLFMSEIAKTENV